MDALPVMTERKKKIDMHVQVASKILQEIKNKIDAKHRENVRKVDDWVCKTYGNVVNFVNTDRISLSFEPTSEAAKELKDLNFLFVFSSLGIIALIVLMSYIYKKKRNARAAYVREEFTRPHNDDVRI